MPISLACPHCDWKGKVKDELAGKTGKCPTCGELFPIPKKGAPPPVPAGQKGAVDDAPDVVDDADIVEDDRPSKSKPGRPAAARGRRDEDEDRPRRRRDEDEDDRPSKSRRRAVDDDEEDRPSKARRRRDEDDEEDDRPSKRRRAVDDDEDEDRPRKRRSGGKVRRRSGGGGGGMSGKKIGQIVGAIIFMLIGIGLLAFYFTFGGRRFPYWAVIIIIVSLISLGQAFMSSDDDE